MKLPICLSGQISGWCLTYGITWLCAWSTWIKKFWVILEQQDRVAQWGEGVFQKLIWRREKRGKNVCGGEGGRCKGRVVEWIHPLSVSLHLSLNICILMWRSENKKELHGDSGPGSVVGITTGYGLDGPGIESRWGRDFPRLSTPSLGPIQSPVQWVPGLSQG